MCDSSGSASTDTSDDNVDQGVYQCSMDYTVHTTNTSVIMSIARIYNLYRDFMISITNDCTCIESRILVHVVPLL